MFRVLFVGVAIVALTARTNAPAAPSTGLAWLPWDPELPQAEAPAPDEFGLASWYGDYHQGLETATGERFDQWALTAAHRTLPLGSHVEVTNVANGRRVRARVNDRGPHIRGRVVDLSRAAFARIGPVGAGIVRVRVRVLAENMGGSGRPPNPPTLRAPRPSRGAPRHADSFHGL